MYTILGFAKYTLPTHTLTHSLTHTHIHTLTHSLTHSHIHTLTHSLTHSHIHTLTHSQEQLLTLVHQFYASVLFQDETITSSVASGDEEQVPSLLVSTSLEIM